MYRYRSGVSFHELVLGQDSSRLFRRKFRRFAFSVFTASIGTNVSDEATPAGVEAEYDDRPVNNGFRADDSTCDSEQLARGTQTFESGIALYSG